MIGIKTKLVLFITGALAAPAALSTDCEPFRKQVSVDGGTTWFDADTAATAPSAGFDTVVEYRFIVKNCETNKDCFDTVIDDPDLGITNADVPDGADDTIKPGEEIIITNADAGFENLLQPERCDTPGDKLNTATETTFVESGGEEQMSNVAYVRCDSAPLAKLGDRVWEDIDGDGVQDCSDNNMNGILGDAGDSGTECGAGIPNVPVTLLQGDCATEVSSTTTDGNGFYLFDNLAAGDYCVQFEEPTDPEFCDAPGGPMFTLANIGDDASDSDANATGTTDPTSLAAGDVNRTIDAGIYCPAALGDRVFEDLDTDGVQDCSDDNMNGILGDTGDSGDECDAGIPNVPVTLLQGDCSTPISSTTTDMSGFYGFDNLRPGDYCIDFGLPPANFCDTDGFILGAPAFTDENVGSDVSDSDAGADGKSDPTNLVSGQIDPTLDAGVVCPAKIGDFVFEDTNENGVQDNGEQEQGVPGVKTTLFECGPDMLAGTADDVPTGEMRVTDSAGMYMYGGEPGVFDLPPGKYYVQFDPTTLPPGFGFTTPNVGDDVTNSDCLPDDGITACTVLPSGAVNLTRDCGIVPPPPPDCQLTLDKSCAVLAPPPQDFDKCEGKLQQFTVIWNGADGTSVSGPGFSGDVDNSQAVTFTGPFSNNDVEVTINGVAGASIFHVSCSDEDFNDPSDCGKMAGDGKGNDAGLINNWQLEGFIDDDGRVLNCTPDGGGEFADNCEYVQPELPSCDNGEKPENLTWRYDGGTGGDGDCADSTFFSIVNADGKLHEDFECTGSVDTSQSITAVDDDGNSYSVAPGGTFTTPLSDSKEITLIDATGGSQSFVLHTSCSQPLEAQATSGALTLVGLDGRTGGQDVAYRYDVTNLGDPLSDVRIEDSELGEVASGLSLGNGASASVDVMTTLFGTTVNTAQASGVLADGSVCAPADAFDSVTVEAIVPPCSIGIELYKVEDDKLKIELTNNGSSTVTMESLTVSYPAARGVIEKVKLDGDAYKFNDSAAPVVDNPASFGPADWTEDEVKKRQIKPGDTKKLEIETFEKSSKDDRFEVTVDFGDGCELFIIVENQRIVD